MLGFLTPALPPPTVPPGLQCRILINHPPPSPPNTMLGCTGGAQPHLPLSVAHSAVIRRVHDFLPRGQAPSLSLAVSSAPRPGSGNHRLSRRVHPTALMSSCQLNLPKTVLQLEAITAFLSPTGQGPPSPNWSPEDLRTWSSWAILAGGQPLGGSHPPSSIPASVP